MATTDFERATVAGFARCYEAALDVVADAGLGALRPPDSLRAIVRSYMAEATEQALIDACVMGERAFVDRMRAAGTAAGRMWLASRVTT